MRFAVGLLLLAACGDGVSAPDVVAPPDASTGLVSVTFRGQGEPHGHQVFFQNADSTLVLATHTGRDGIANAYMAPGGFVTLVHTIDTTYLAYTWAGVQPGDHLVLDEGAPPQPFEPVAIRVDIPADPGAQFYQLASTCGSSVINGTGGPVPVELENCPTGRATMLVRAFHGTDINERVLFREDVEVMQGDVVVFDPPYIPRTPTMLHGIHIPPETIELSARQALIAGGDELLVANVFGAPGLSPQNGEATAMLSLPNLPNTIVLSELDTQFAAGTSATSALTWGPLSASLTLDFGALRPYTERPAYVRGQHQIRWKEQPLGDLADAVLTGFSWVRAGGIEFFSWQIIAPRTDEPAVHFPVLPIPGFIVTDVDSINEPSLLANIKADGGYGRIRPHLLGTWGTGRAWPIDGTTGHVVVQGLSQ